jgi:DNA-binding GntR family transcriptional regulator
MGGNQLCSPIMPTTIPSSRNTSVEIVDRVVHAILAGRLRPGTRLGEVQLGELFDVSRTRVREALIRLQARGIVQVNARRGWFVCEPSPDEARDAFAARRVVEVGLLHCSRRVDGAALAALSAHIRQEREAIASGDVGARSFLLGDFHVCMAEALGNRALADILRNLTARTVLTAMLYQSQHDAAASCADHAHIVAALEAGDMPEAVRLMDQHIGDVEASLGVRAAVNPLATLRQALVPTSAGMVAPIGSSEAGHVQSTRARSSIRHAKPSNH